MHKISFIRGTLKSEDPPLESMYKMGGEYIFFSTITLLQFPIVSHSSPLGMGK